MTAPGFACSRSTTPAINERPRGSSTKSYAGCHSGCMWCRRTTAPSSSPTSTGTSRVSTSVTSISVHARPVSTARWSDPTVSTPRSSISSSTRTGSATTSTCSTRSCVNGRITTITIVRTERWEAKPRTSDCWRKRGLKRYGRLENLQFESGACCRTGTCDLLARSHTLYPAELRARTGTAGPRRPAVYGVPSSRRAQTRTITCALQRVQKREPVLLRAMHCDDAGSDHVAVGNQIRHELLVGRVGVPFRLHRELRGEKVCRHVADGKPRPSLDHRIDRVAEIRQRHPVRACIQQIRRRCLLRLRIRELDHHAQHLAVLRPDGIVVGKRRRKVPHAGDDDDVGLPERVAGLVRLVQVVGVENRFTRATGPRGTQDRRDV